MTRTIICTTGTSVARGIPWGDISLETVRIRLTDMREGAGNSDFLISASAETNSLHRLKTGSADNVALLHTDTEEGTICANALADIVRSDFGATPTCHKIEGLQVEDGTLFRRVGIQHLFQTLDTLCARSAEIPGDEVVLNATGGFKSTVPYLTLFGLLNRIPVTYIFERSDALLTLPPAPVNFDFERIGQASDALWQLSEEGTMQRSDFFAAIPGLPHHLRDWYESLLEEDGDGYVTLSAIGSLFATARTEQTTEVLLSPTAREAYDRASGIARQQFNFILERSADPLWRKHKGKSFHGADLTVYKPGNTAQRAAGYVRGQRVYICELFADHDDYERALQGITPAHYDTAEFDVWTLPPDDAPTPATEEDAIRQLEARCATLEAEWEKSERLVDQMEAQATQNGNYVHGARMKYQRERQENDALRRVNKAIAEEVALLRAQLDGPWWKRIFAVRETTEV